MTTEDLLDGLVLQNDQLEEDLEGANARIAFLKQELEGANARIAFLKQELAMAERKVVSARQRYAKAIPELRDHYLGKIKELADRVAELESVVRQYQQ